jgi:outer membrane protein assembly factor BamB
MPVLGRRLLATFLAGATLALTACSSGDDADDRVAVVTRTRAALPTAPSTTAGAGGAVTPTIDAGASPTGTTVVGATTAPGATTVTIGGRATVAVSPGQTATCRARDGSATITFPASLVLLDVATGAVKWSVCPIAPGDATAPLDLGGNVGATFTADADGARTFQAFTRDGLVSWSIPLATATVLTDHAGTAYVADATGAGTRALDAANGQERWKVPGEEARAARPDAVVTTVPGPPAQVIVRDPATSTLRWAQALPAPAKSVAITSDRVVAVYETTIVGAPGPVPGIAAFDLATGEPRWVQERPDAGAAAVVDDTVLVWNTDDSTTAVNAADGSQRWRRTGRPLAGAGGTVVADEGLLFLGASAGDTDVRVVDLATNNGKWSATSTDLRAQALGAGAKLLLFPTSLGGVEAVTMAEGNGAWSFDWPPAPDSYTNGVAVSPDVALVAVGWGPR